VSRTERCIGPVVIESAEGVKEKSLSGSFGLMFRATLLLDSGVLGFHAVHKSPLIYKVIEKEGL